MIDIRSGVVACVAVQSVFQTFNYICEEVSIALPIHLYVYMRMWSSILLLSSFHYESKNALADSLLFEPLLSDEQTYSLN